MGTSELYETAKDTDQRITEINVSERLLKNGAVIPNTVVLDSSKTFQTFKGFGGALTESAGYVLSLLSGQQRKEIIEKYYSAERGLGYVFGRTHINSCDFSLENWSCLEEKSDTLEKFSMKRTDMYMTPLIAACQETAGKERFNLIATPWSPPAWMKDNGDMNHGGKLLESCRKLWAQYYVRFIQEMQKRNINVKYISIQNECAANQTWDSCLYTGKEEGEFAVHFLKPALKEADLETKILVWDHNRDLLKQRADETMSVPGAAEAVDGFAYHWYSGDQYENVKQTAEKYSGKEIFFTEGCVELGPRKGKWFTGERYAHNIINDLNSGCNAWIDWNIVLDEQGGPNHVGNYCDAPVLVNTKDNTVFYNSSFWYIGHFSRFIKPGAVRIYSEMSSWMMPTTIDGKIGRNMECTAFKNPDGSIAAVITNLTEDNENLNLILDGKTTQVFLPPRSIQTWVFQKQ